MKKQNRTKKQILLAMIGTKAGATLGDLCVALGWQEHSVRGKITTLGKTIKIESFQNADGARTYRAKPVASKKGGAK